MMKDPTTSIRVRVVVRQRAKIVSAELGQSIQSFCSEAIVERIRQHEDRKARTLGLARERQVEFLSV